MIRTEEGKSREEVVHFNSRVIDAHSDIAADVIRLRSRGESDVFGRVHLGPWSSGGVNGAIATVGGDQLLEPTPFEYAMSTIEVFKKDLSERPESLAFALDADEFASNIDSGRITFAFSIEGSRPLEGSLEKLGALHNAGLRFVGLTWSSANEVGAGVGREELGGLTPFGRTAIERMAELGIVADVSHAAEQTFWDALNLGTGNIIASHSNAKSLCDHPRNLTDDQIRALADSGGFVGICIFPDFLQGDPSGIEDVVDQIVYVADLVGVDHVALGLDFFDFLPEDEALARLGLASIPTGGKYPNYVSGLEGIHRLSALTVGLMNRGMVESDVHKVLGDNIVRAWRSLSKPSTGLTRSE